MIREFIDQMDKLPQKTLANYVQIDKNLPLIGIISAQNELSSAQGGLDELCKKVREGIVAAGGNAAIAYVPSVETTAITGQSAKYDLPSRDLAANAVELICSNGFYDGLVFAASEPNIVSGMLLGAIRMNMPCAFVCQGTMAPFADNAGEHGFVYLCEQISRIKTGRASFEQIEQIERDLPLTLGTDCDRYGPNSFNCVLESFGLAVRGNGTAPAASVERKNIAFQTGKLAVKLANDRWTPRRAINQISANNAVALDLACGGSSTTMLNLIAICREVGVRNTNFKTIGEAAKSTPTLLASQEARCIMPQFHKAGGVYAMLKRLLQAGLIQADNYVYDGVTLAELLADVTPENDQTIRCVDGKQKTGSKLRVIYGNVAEGGAFVQCGCKQTAFVGKAKVYQNEETAIDALLHREIKAGDVVVIRGEGPKSGPGMREIFMSLALLQGYDLGEKVAVITDGRIADFYKGFVVGHITPETGEQNIFSVLQDGDEIEISLAKGKVSFDIKSKDLAMRYRRHETETGNYGNVFLKNWAKNCSTAVEGCVQKPAK